MYDQSHHCLVQTSSQTIPYQINHDSLILFSAQNGPIRLVMSLSCLTFIIARTLFNRSSQYNILFYREHTYMIGHVVVLSIFHERPHLVQSIMIIQFLFRCKSHLYNYSHRCCVWSSSQTIPYQIEHESFVLFLVQSGPVRSVTSLSCLIFVTNYTLSYWS